MAAVLIIFCIVLLILFIISNEVWIKIIKDDSLEILISLPIIGVSLKKRKEENKSKKPKEKDKNNVKAVLYLIKRLKHSKITVSKLLVPIKLEDFSPSYFTTPYSYQALIHSALAYLDTKARSFVVSEGAVIISSEAKSLCLDLTIKTKLFHLFPIAYFFLKNKIKENLKRK